MDQPTSKGRHGRTGAHGKDTPPNPSGQKLHPKCRPGSCHAEQVLQVLNSDRRDGIFTDVVLVTDGQGFPCHRATLSGHSTYFRALFSTEAKGGGREINLREISPSSMGLALDYMYGSSIVIHEDNVEGLLELSSVLQISRLKEACVAFLEGRLHPFNCLGIMKFAGSFSISSLAEKSKRLLLEGFVEVSLQKEFLDLDIKDLRTCLSSQRLAVPKEEVVFEAVMRWVNHDVASRKGSLKDLLMKVRLPLLDPVYFLEKVETDPLIRESKECVRLLQGAWTSLILGPEVSSQWSRPRRSMELAETILIIGGCDKKGILNLPFVDLWHPGSGRWKSLCNMPGQSKLEFAACAFKNNVYVSGGHVNSRDVWLLNPQLNIWMKVACLQKGRWRHKMAALQGKIYAVGGYDGFHHLASMECYDAFYNSWMTASPLPEAVSSAAVAPCLGRLYVIGGAVGDSTNTNKVQRYDPKTNVWCLLPPAPFTQRCISAVTLDSLIYIMGGVLKTIFSFRPQEEAWEEEGSFPGSLDHCGLTACDGKIYILGGRHESGESTNKAFTFNPATGMLEPQSPLQRCTSYHGCVTVLRRMRR